ncbi:MAG TPA: BMP family ABC transporter substrate-binding protein [Solirubrobacteraceae bacterium]|nr:BMP family ABC transporter substrate-binding protein [Solirubrobacteraceae bacterium]
MDRTPSRALMLLLAAFAALTLGLAACGGEEESPTAGGETTTAAPEEKKIRVAMVTDIGGLNDRSFNSSAYKGLQRAEKELGAEIRALTSSSNADYVPNLSTLARQKYDLVIAVGFLMAEATEKVAKSFPETNFAIIDYSQAAMKSKPSNVQGLLFAEQQAGYLVGYMAGLYAKDQGGEQVVSSVGGQKIPPVDHYIAGFQAGAKAANPEIKTLNAYSQDFVDQAKCKEIALNQIEQGSQVVFQVAGQCGLGALDAAKENDVQGIGVDADQSFLGDHILTSALKKIDEAVFATVQDVQGDAFKGGTDNVFDLASEGVGYGKTNAEGEKYAEQVDEIQQQIASGEISDIPDTVPGK